MFELTANIGALELLLIWSFVIFASILRSFTGFSFALTAVPTFSLFSTLLESVILSPALTLTSNLASVRSYWGIVPLKPILPLVFIAVIGTIIGTVILAFISPTQFQLWAGMSVIIACVVLAFFKSTTHRASPMLINFTSLLSGLINGALAIPGPPLIIYVMFSEPVPERSRALLITFFLASAVIALVSFSVAGFIQIQSLWHLLLAFPAMAAGDKIGFYLFKKYGEQLYRRISVASLHKRDKNLNYDS